nr:ribonuclease H-like domain-containing protein [Tanacetum cinerariifolium]
MVAWIDVEDQSVGVEDALKSNESNPKKNFTNKKLDLSEDPFSLEKLILKSAKNVNNVVHESSGSDRKFPPGFTPSQSMQPNKDGVNVSQEGSSSPAIEGDLNGQSNAYVRENETTIVVTLPKSDSNGKVTPWNEMQGSEEVVLVQVVSLFATSDVNLKESRGWRSGWSYAWRMLTWKRRVSLQQIIASLHYEFSMTDLEPRFLALKRILRYVRGTLDHGLQLFSSSTTSLVTYSDADWSGCLTRRPTSGYCVFIGNNLLFWSYKRQPTLSRSSAQIEYHGVANAVVETCWLRNLLRELRTTLSFATLVCCDNVSAVCLSSNLVQHQHTNRIEIDIHFFRDLVAAGQVRVLHAPSRYLHADIFTKRLSSALFE